MTCTGCIARQRKIVAFVCKNPLSRFCIAAKNRLAKMSGEAEHSPDPQTYQTRMMTAETASAPVQYSRSEPVEAAPYGYKADGTPRKRPGRAPAEK